MRVDDRHDETGAPNREDRLGRLWAATRPPEPSAADWDRVWAQVADRLDRAEAPAPAAPLRLVAEDARPRPLRRLALGVLLLAQAAAVILAVSLAWQGEAKPTPTVRIEPGTLVLIRLDEGDVKARDVSAESGPDGVNPWYLVYNLLEATARPVVAMSE